MNPYIGDRPLDPPDEVETQKCWSCKRIIEIEIIRDCDGFCPACGVEIELEDCMPDMRDQGEPNDYPED